MNEGSGQTAVFVYQFRLDKDFFVEAQTRMFESRPLWRRAARPFAILLLVAGLLQTVSPDLKPIPILLGVLGGIAAWWALLQLVRWISLRAFRRRPVYGQSVTVAITDEGVRATTAISSSLQEWAAFTDAVSFEDGILLRQGPSYGQWLPNSAQQSGVSPAEVSDFIQRHLAPPTANAS